MKSYFIYGLLLWATLLKAENAVIEYKESYNGFGTVAGKIISEKAEGPFVVTVENAGKAYSTITDSNGKWAIVFRHRSTKFDVTAKPLSGRDLELHISDTIK